MDRLLAGLNFHRAARGETPIAGEAAGSRCSFCAREVDATAFSSPRARVCETCLLVGLTYYQDVAVQGLRGGRIDRAAALRRAAQDMAGAR